MSTNEKDGLSIWEKVQATDPAYTKPFTGHLGFAGTAVNPTYVFRKATEVFGPIGIGWGADVLKEELVKGAPLAYGADGTETAHAIIHKAYVEVWYMLGDKRGTVRQYGGTQFVGRGPNGQLYTDDDAAKKSMTDGMLKCLALLGFSADIHLGLFDDVKYVQGLDAFFAQQANGGAPAETAAQSQFSAQQQSQSTQQGDGKYSRRYLQWKERIGRLAPDDIPHTREVIQRDSELSQLERSLLLGSKDLKVAAPQHSNQRDHSHDQGLNNKVFL